MIQYDYHSEGYFNKRHAKAKKEPIQAYGGKCLCCDEGRLEFLEKIAAKKGKSTLQAKLVLDYHSFRTIAEQLKQSDGIVLHTYVDLVSVGGLKLARGDYAMQIDRDSWVAARQEDNKPAPQGGLAIDHHSTALITENATQLRKEIAQIEEKSIDDPVLQLQKKAFESLIETVKQNLLDRPETKELKGFEPLIAACSIVRVSPRWAIAAALLSSFEGYVKKWLVQHASETYDTLKNKNFDELTGKMRGQLKQDQINADQTRLAEFASIRVYRNLVLHEMHEPNDIELEKIKLQTFELMKYVNSLKPLT